MLQNFWEMTVTDFDKRKDKQNDAKTERKTEESEERFLHRDYDWTGDLNNHDAKVKEETESGEESVKMETDEAFFKRESKEKQSTPQTRPMRLRIPRSTFYDNCQSKDVQKQQWFIHETLGHMSLDTIQKGLMEVRGYESVANVIDVMTEDQHCNSCAICQDTSRRRRSTMGFTIIFHRLQRKVTHVSEGDV